MVATLLLGLTACTHTDLARNAPGHVNLEGRPEHPESREPEQPEDPGERLLVLSYGGFIGGGVFVDESGDPDFATGPEIAVDVGEREQSHFEDDFFVLADRSLGLRLGLTALDAKIEPPGPGYAELAFTEHLFRVGAGWSVDVDDERHGPQATLAMGPLYLRANHQFTYGTAVHLGLMLQGSHAWVWSR